MRLSVFERERLIERVCYYMLVAVVLGAALLEIITLR